MATNHTLQFQMAERHGHLEIHFNYNIEMAWLINTVTVRIKQECALHEQSEANIHISPLPKTLLNITETLQLQQYIAVMYRLAVRINLFIDDKNNANITEFINSNYSNNDSIVLH